MQIKNQTKSIRVIVTIAFTIQKILPTTSNLPWTIPGGRAEGASNSMNSAFAYLPNSDLSHYSVDIFFKTKRRSIMNVDCLKERFVDEKTAELFPRVDQFAQKDVNMMSRYDF